ncbi:hypothetical protein MMC29_000535, partial [Sticta canariensis]|nr:hypothetical protein [Sticta canariensis]
MSIKSTQRAKKGGKKGKETIAEVTYPLVDWTTNSFALTYKMLGVLEEYDGLRRTIWAGEGEAATGKSKADAHRDIAEKILHNLPQYSALVTTDSGRKHYGATVKARITKLQEQYATVKERLGVTGAGLPTEEAIWVNSELMNVWEAVKKTCPYWYQLHGLIGSRTSLCDHAITNSQRDMEANVFMTRRQPIEMDDVFGDDDEIFPQDKVSPDLEP